jgi:hypothetical protein
VGFDACRQAPERWSDMTLWSPPRQILNEKTQLRLTEATERASTRPPGIDHETVLVVIHGATASVSLAKWPQPTSGSQRTPLPDVMAPMTQRCVISFGS